MATEPRTALGRGDSSGTRPGWLVGLLASAVLLLLLGCTRDQPTPPASVPPATVWTESVQIITALELPADQAERLGVTLNGIWSGAPEVEAAHRAGRLASVSIDALMGDESDEGRFDLTPARSRDVFGDETLVPWVDWEEDAYVLTINHPTFWEYLLERGREAIDAGADAILVDVIQTFAILISAEPGGAGFADADLQVFDAFLRDEGFESFGSYLVEELLEEEPDEAALEEAFGVASLDELTVPLWLRSQDATWDEAREEVLTTYIEVHERNSFEKMRTYLDALRAYSAEHGRTVALSANLVGVGNRVEASALYSVAWAPLLDFLVFEHDEPRGAGDTPELALLPAGKFAAAYRLGRALVPGLVVATPSVTLIPTLEARASYESYLEYLFAEAYAFEGQWMLGAANGQDETTRLSPDRLGPYSSFVRRHHALLEGPRRPHEVAVLYVNEAALGDPSRHTSYSGVAQALAELNVQYDVIFTGDARFGEHLPSADRLAAYGTLLVPMASPLTDGQRAALAAYAASGGALITFGPSDLADTAGVVGAPDHGLAYRQDDAGANRAALQALLPPAVPAITTLPAGVVVTAYQRERAGGLVVHLLNDGYEPDTDTIAALASVALVIPGALVSFERCRAEYLTPEVPQPVAVACRIEADGAHVTVPSLAVYGILVIRPDGAELP